MLKILLWLCCFLPQGSMAASDTSVGLHEIVTNETVMKKAPKWLKGVRVEKVTNRIQYKLEWSTRKINVLWYHDQNEFEKSHSLGPMAAAVTRSNSSSQKILLGPTVSEQNFDQIFGHELVHVIFRQKYVGSIPGWLEEGLANHLSQKDKVNYKKLATQPFPEDVRQLTHPYNGDKASISYHYVASQALAEMLEKKCDLENLIRLSVQRKMTDYIKTYCEISDINQAFRNWVVEQSKK